MKLKRWHILIIAILVVWIVTFGISKIIENSDSLISNNQIAIVPVEGLITSYQQTFPTTQVKNSKSIIDSLQKANSNKNVKAIILEINSPGGTVVASKEVAETVEAIEKPVISVIREVGASGAYWIASSSDLIIADELSITGSIGVTSSYLEFSGLLNKYDIEYQEIKAGEYKEIGNPLSNLSPEEKQILQEKVNIIHQSFLNHVQAKRNIKDMNKIKTGEFFLGLEAKQLGLVDKLGNLQLGVEEAKKLSNIENAELVYYQERKNILGLFNTGLSEASYSIGQGIGSQLKPSTSGSIYV